MTELTPPQLIVLRNIIGAYLGGHYFVADFQKGYAIWREAEMKANGLIRPLKSGRVYMDSQVKPLIDGGHLGKTSIGSFTVIERVQN